MSEPIQLIRARAKTMANLPPWDQIIRGTLQHLQLACGKPNCRCHRSKEDRHGPYWRVGVALKGRRVKTVGISARQVPRIRQAIRAYQKLWAGLCRISQINLELIKAGR